FRSRRLPVGGRRGDRAVVVNLTPLAIGGRMDRLRARVDDIDALLVTRLVNVRYLTGFTGSAAMLLVTRAGATFVTDGRYRDQSADQLDAAGVTADIAIGLTQADQRAALATAADGVARLGLEADGVTWAQQRDFAAWFPGATLVATDGLVDGLRMVKEPGEVDRIRAACAIADDALEALLPTLAAGPTERDFALRLEFAMRERGASAVSFDPIVASGPNGAKPHARPGDRVIDAGELVVIDFGCIVDGYCSDMTRTVSVGAPSPEARRVCDTVLDAQQQGCDAVAVGVECAAVDRASRAAIETAGWGDAFIHGTGHGVGLEIHESPRVASTSTGTLDAGHVVTVEPGVYLPGIGGVRIEDTLVVTAEGSRALTLFPKDLVV
ncbi:MAG: aminopeptidase P family protein, partial [Acidimicrobiia bacterium]